MSNNLKGYDTINRYCGRLEMRLKNIEGKEALVEEIKQHLREQAENYIEEGCLPEAAELLAINDMGSDIALAAGLRKYGDKIKESGEPFFETIKNFEIEKRVEYTPLAVMAKNINTMKWKELFYTVLIPLYIGVIWLFIVMAFDLSGSGEIRLWGSVTFMSVTAFSVYLGCLDRYLPVFNRKSLILLGISAAVTVILYPLIRIFLLYGIYYSFASFIAVITQKPQVYIYYSIKTAVAAAIIAAGKNKKIMVPLVSIAAFLPLLAQIANAVGIRLIFAAMVGFIVFASVYVTFFAKNKYVQRLAVQCIGLIGLAEIFALYYIRFLD